MHFLFVYPSPGIWGGIETQIASYGLHRLAAFAACPVFRPDGAVACASAGSAASATALPTADRLHERGLALPLHSEMHLADVDRVCDALLALLDGKASRSASA